MSVKYYSLESLQNSWIITEMHQSFPIKANVNESSCWTKTPKKFVKILFFILGAGSFGVAMEGLYDEKEVFVKKVKSQSSYVRGIFAKEALLVSKICHQNIVSLTAVHEDPVSIMMEYCVFSFTPFQKIEQFNSLDQLLQYLSTEDLFTYFPWILNFMASNTGKGLAYLHNNNMVRRNIKPGNILVTNIHYAHDTKYLASLFKKNPCDLLTCWFWWRSVQNGSN